MELNPPTIGNKAVVFVDGANGVGAIQLEKLAALVDGALKINVVNRGEGKLNHEVRFSGWFWDGIDGVSAVTVWSRLREADAEATTE